MKEQMPRRMVIDDNAAGEIYICRKRREIRRVAGAVDRAANELELGLGAGGGERGRKREGRERQWE